jgi:transcriptional regulator with XRE-family HTH domain
MTQGDLAAKSGVDYLTISRIERGIHAPSLMTIEVLADAMKMDIDEMIGREKPPTFTDNERLRLREKVLAEMESAVEQILEARTAKATLESDRSDPDASVLKVVSRRRGPRP